jgi:hypothetical protein
MNGVRSRHGRDGNAYKIVVEHLKGRDHPEDPRLDERTILKCILDKYGVWLWNGFIQLGITIGGLL